MSATIVANSSFFLSDVPCSPFGLCLNENGTKYLCTVTNAVSKYIISFDLNIQNPEIFTTKPEFINGELSGICLTADKQNYLVGIYGGSKIIKLDLNGEYVGLFMDSTEKLPDGSSALVSICGICLNAEGTHYLFVNDGLPNVCKVDLEGKNPMVFIYECIFLYECIGEPKLGEPDLVEPKLSDLDEPKSSPKYNVHLNLVNQ